MRPLLSAVLTTVLSAATLVVTPAPTTATPVATPVTAEQGSAFTPLSPARVLDTRDGTGGVTGPVGAARTIALNLSARVPSTATAVVLNVTAVAPTASTYVTVFPHGQARPLASNLNVVAGDVRPNLVTVALGTGRTVDLYNHAGSVHLLADLAGYYAPGAGGLYTATLPYRKLDTRQEGGPLGPGGTRVLDLTGSVPAGATAVTLNLTATGATASTFVTAWPTGTARPAASNINLTAGGTRPNLVTVALGAGDRVSFYNLAGQVNLVVDMVGFYTPAFGATFVPLSPSRVLDTRTGDGPLHAGGSVIVDPGPLVPANATAMLLNVTGVGATGSTFVSVWSGDGRPDSAGSVLNLAVGETAANLAAIAFSPTRPVTAYNSWGSVHVLADLAGAFVLPAATCTVDCVHSWGDNETWQLGRGPRVPSSPTAARVTGLSGVATVAGSGSTQYALHTDGTVSGWGTNFFGQLGGGWYGDWSPVPTRVPGLTGVTALTAGAYHALALLDDGTVRGWGVMFAGGLGNGTSTPIPVGGLTGITALATTWFTSYALRDDGTVLALGDNQFGLLGNGSTVEKSETPVQVTGLTDVTAIAAQGDTAYALRSDGTVWAWGLGDQGQLGTGFTCGVAQCHSRVPVQVVGLSGVTALASGSDSAYALHADGSVSAWGSNDQGQLGNGLFCNACYSSAPVKVTGLTGVTALAAGGATGYALRTDGTVWAWGRDEDSELGAGTTCGQPDGCRATVPVRVAGLAGVTAIGPGLAVVPFA
jgi:alpha-tubulin suppressor-like RCC1 family protein